MKVIQFALPALFALSMTAVAQPSVVEESVRTPAAAVLLGQMEQDILSDRIEAILQKHSVPGAHVTLTRGSSIVYARGFGIDPSRNGAAYTDVTAARLASATKFLTGLTVLSLIEDGELTYDTTLGELNADLPKQFLELPVWRVLNHTSGVPMIVVRDDFNTMPREEMLALSMDDLLAMIGDEPLDFRPGEGWHYQQSAYALLANALEKTTGRDWQSLVSEHVLRPGGLVETRFTGPGEIAGAYIVENGERRLHDFAGPALLAAAGGYDTSPGDLARLMIALAEGRIVESENLMSAAMQPARLHRLDRNIESEGYGPGLIVQQFGKHRLIGHSGGGGVADIRYVPGEEIGIAVLTNRAGGTGVASEIADMLAERYLGPAQRAEVAETGS